MRVLLLSENTADLQSLERQFSADERVSHFRRQALRQKPPREIDLRDVDLLVLDDPFEHGVSIAELESLCRSNPRILVMLIARREDSAALVAAVGAGVREILRWPATTEEIDHAIARCAEKISSVGAERHGQVIAVIASKGGSGATFVATNLAYACATSLERRTLIIDFDLQYGDASFALGKEPQGTNVIALIQDENLESAFLEAACLPLRRNLSLLASPFTADLPTSVDAAGVGRLLALATQAFDVVIIDVPPQVDAAAAAVMSQSNRILQIVTPNVASLRNQQRQRLYLDNLGVPLAKLSVVLNKMPPKSTIGTGEHPFAEEIAARLADEVVGRIPFDDESAMLALAAGESVFEVREGSSVSRSLDELARLLCHVDESQPGWRNRVAAWLKGSPPAGAR